MHARLHVVPMRRRTCVNTCLRIYRVAVDALAPWTSSLLSAVLFAGGGLFGTVWLPLSQTQAQTDPNGDDLDDDGTASQDFYLGAQDGDVDHDHDHDQDQEHGHEDDNG